MIKDVAVGRRLLNRKPLHLSTVLHFWWRRSWGAAGRSMGAVRHTISAAQTQQVHCMGTVRRSPSAALMQQTARGLSTERHGHSTDAAKAIRPSGYKDIKLKGYKAIRLKGYKAIRL